MNTITTFSALQHQNYQASLNIAKARPRFGLQFFLESQPNMPVIRQLAYMVHFGVSVCVARASYLRVRLTALLGCFVNWTNIYKPFDLVLLNDAEGRL